MVIKAFSIYIVFFQEMEQDSLVPKIIVVQLVLLTLLGSPAFYLHDEPKLSLFSWPGFCHDWKLCAIVCILRI